MIWWYFIQIKYKKILRLNVKKLIKRTLFPIKRAPRKVMPQSLKDIFTSNPKILIFLSLKGLAAPSVAFWGLWEPSFMSHAFFPWIITYFKKAKTEALKGTTVWSAMTLSQVFFSKWSESKLFWHQLQLFMPNYKLGQVLKKRERLQPR